MYLHRIHTYPLKLYIRKLPVIILGSISLFMNLFSWVWLIIQIPNTGEQMFLHYNILFGVDYIGDGWRIFLVPLLGSVIFIVNMFVSWLFYRYDSFISYLFVLVSTICQIFVVIASILLVFLNV